MPRHEDHPNRCEGQTASGQCMHKALHGSRFCREHGGKDRGPAEAMRSFLLAKAQDRARLAEVADELEPVKHLRDSIGILTMLIERRFNAIQGENDLLSACGPLTQMLAQMEKLTCSCHKLEQNLGQLLAKHAVLALAKKMIEIIIAELEGIEGYERIVDAITIRLIDTIRATGNAEQPAFVALPRPEDTA